LDDDERERARKLVVATDGIDRTISAAARFLEGAHSALDLLPSENLRSSFSSLITSQLHDLPSY
jgi:geranylgeranyl pyrophosphate synthase